LAYILIYLNTGCLPWERLGNNASFSKIGNMKKDLINDENIDPTLCEFLK